MDFVRANPVLVIGALLLIGGILHLYAWTELEEFNWFDIVMREGPPFEDLSGTGQLLLIASWLLGAAAVVLLVIVYVWPRFDRLIVLSPVS